MVTHPILLLAYNKSGWNLDDNVLTLNNRIEKYGYDIKPQSTNHLYLFVDLRLDNIFQVVHGFSV